MTNNGFSTLSFNLKRVSAKAIHYRHPSYSFVIVLERLAISLRNNNRIRGIKVDGKELKLVIFADDMTSFVFDN